MKHEEILKLLFAVSQANPQNDTIIFDVTDPFRPVPVQIKNSLNAKHFDLLAAAPFLYQSLYNATAMLESISVRLETYDSPEGRIWIEAIAVQTRATIDALRIATEGVNKISKENDAERNSLFKKL